MTIDNIIDFLLIQQQQNDRRIEQLFRQADTQATVSALIANKTLTPKDHQLFLAFIAYAEDKELAVQPLFIDALKMPKHHFQATYDMNWYSIVELTATFLAIVHKNDKIAYNQFIEQLNDCR